LKKELDFSKKQADQTISAIDELKKEDPEVFEKIEPYLKRHQDKDVREDIKRRK